jgi:hypothetical protein
MPDELAIAIATTLAAKGAEAMIAGGRSAVAALARLIRDKFGDRSREAAALEAATAEPADRDRQLILADALRRAMAADPGFAARVLAQWRAAERETTVGTGAVANIFAGTAETVVQARDIHGDITL